MGAQTGLNRRRCSPSRFASASAPSTRCGTSAICEGCRNEKAHVRAAPGHFLQNEIVRAGRGDAAVVSNLRELVGRYGLLGDPHRAIDARILEHVAWLLETRRLQAVECVLLRTETPVVESAGAKDEVAPPRQKPVEDPKTWVGIELVDDLGRPVPNQRYRVKVPEGTIAEGTLDAQGRARISGIDPGVCEISFPEIEAREWRKA